MKENRGKTMAIYDISDLVGRAFPKAFTPANIQSGFKIAERFFFDHDTFSYLEFLPINVTDRLVLVLLVKVSANRSKNNRSARNIKFQKALYRLKINPF